MIVLASGIAAAAYYVLGAVWFTPLFGRIWDRSIGYDRGRSGRRFPPSYYIVPLVGAVVASSVIGASAAVAEIDGMLGGVVLGILAGAVAAAASLTNALTPHTPRPFLFAAVTGGYHLVGCSVAGAIVGSMA